MLIGRSNNDKQRQAPNDLSDYVRTYNHAIDLVTQAVGYAKKASIRQVAAIRLKPTAYRNFVEGIKVLLRQQGSSDDLDPAIQLEWEGYPVLEGGRAQIDSVVVEYVENAINPVIHK